MDRRQLQIFHAVLEEGSFTRAANSLHIAQSAVSIAIRKLEEEFGMALLNRADRVVSLTAAGHTLQVHCDRILTQFQQAQLEMSELQTMERGTVSLGTSAMAGNYYFPEKIAAFRRQYPHIRVSVIGEGTRRAQQLLLDGEIDMALVNVEDASDELEVRTLDIRDEVVACVSADHPFASKKKLGFPEFAEQSLVVYREGYYLREVIETLGKEHNVEPNIGVETNLMRLMTDLICRGEGVGFCLKRVVEQEPGLYAVSFKDPIFLQLGFAWKRNRYVSKANRAFMNFVLGA